jgi:rhodanese-related sulfurtransferase
MSKESIIAPRALHQLLSAKPTNAVAAGECDTLLVDVREPAEYHAEKIENAHNVPLSQLNKEKLESLNPEQKKIIFYCQSGRRSAMACKKVKDLNTTSDVCDLTGGISAWKAEQLPVMSSPQKLLPLDRQVQLLIGSLILLGVILGYFLHPSLLLLSAMMGAGLINAGLTGWCGLARLIARLPWNQKIPTTNCCS